MPIDQIFKFVSDATPTMILSAISMALIIVLYQAVTGRIKGSEKIKQEQSSQRSDSVSAELLSAKMQCTEVVLDRIASAIERQTNSIERQTKTQDELASIVSRQDDTIKRQNEMLKEFKDLSKTQNDSLNELRKAQEQHNYRAEMNFNYMVEAGRMRDKIRDEHDEKIAMFQSEIAKTQQKLFDLYDRLRENPVWTDFVKKNLNVDFPKLDKTEKDEKGGST